MNIQIFKNNTNSFRCHDLGTTDLWDKIHLLFKAAIDNEDMSPEVNDFNRIEFDLFCSFVDTDRRQMLRYC